MNCAQTNWSTKINKPTENIFLQKEDPTHNEKSSNQKHLRSVKPTKNPCDNVIHHDDRTNEM